MQSCESSCNGNQDSGGGGSGDGDGNGDGDCRQIILSKTRPPSPTKVSISKPQSDEQVVDVDVDFDDDDDGDDVDEFQIDISYLPDFLLVEILMRLPVKSVFRFKCVSKHWLSLISDPFFARMYVSRKLNYSSLSPFRILYRYIYVSAFPQILDRLRPDSPHVSVSENFSVLFLSSYQEQQHADQFKILAVSKGLILCCLLGPLIYYVCDPVTGKWVSLPRHQSRVHSRHPIFMGEGLVALTNEDNVVTSYKVVRVEYRSAESAYLNFESYSSETGEWKNYRLSFSQPVQLIKRGSPFLFNGAMHWFTYGKGMVAFDPCKNVKECRLIRFPNHRDIESENNYDGLYRLCEECKGKLRYFETATDTAEPFCFRMWVMQDYEKAEWKLEHRATRSEIWSDDPYISSYLLHVSFVPLAYHPFNLDIVYLRCAERACIVTYNFITKRLEVSCNPVGIVDDLSWRVVMPFVLPMWPAPLPKRARRGTKRFRPGNAICAR